ncbi:unnamed protein product [Sphagnum tenellum]
MRRSVRDLVGPGWVRLGYSVILMRRRRYRVALAHVALGWGTSCGLVCGLWPDGYGYSVLTRSRCVGGGGEQLRIEDEVVDDVGGFASDGDALDGVTERSMREKCWVGLVVYWSIAAWLTALR